MDGATPIDADEVLAQILAGGVDLSGQGQLTFPLSDGTMATVEEIDADAEPFTVRLIEILGAADLACIIQSGTDDGDEYRPEAHDLASRLRAVPAAELDEDRVALLTVEVLWHWFAAEDGSAMIDFGAEDCRPVARQILALIARA